MALSRRTGRSRLTLVLLLLTSITVLTLDFRGSSAIQSMRDVAGNVFSPVRDTASSAFSPFSNAWNGLWHYGSVNKENEQLRARIAQLEGQQDANADAAQQLKDLSQVQGITQFTDLPSVTTRVTAGPATNFEHTIEIDKGSDQGIKKGMPVVASAGLVGRVTDVFPSRSVIKLVSDPDVVVGVRLASSGETALAHGQGDGKPLVVDEGVAKELVVPPNEIVVTSGEDRAIFPGGIPMGTVEKSELSAGQLDQVLTVTPAVDLSRLSFLKVLLWEPPA
jgi:rod shape-determining protein MreC